MKDIRNKPSIAVELLAMKAECMYELGQAEAAAALINHNMSWPDVEKHVPTLSVYAYIAKRHDKFEESLRALLKAIVLDTKNKKLRKMLSEILELDVGMEELVNQIRPGKTYFLNWRT